MSIWLITSCKKHGLIGVKNDLNTSFRLSKPLSSTTAELTQDKIHLIRADLDVGLDVKQGHGGNLGQKWGWRA